jgi:UDP-N-acetylglucosamine acyltransferase
VSDSQQQIHPNAQIGKNVEIGPFVSIDEDVQIGAGTWIGPNVTIFDGARIGENCEIFPGAVISAIPQDLKYEGEETETIIGDNVTIRECVTINKGTKDQYKTVVQDNTLLMAYVHVAHDCHIAPNCILSNAVNLAGHINIDEYAVIGGMSAVHQFVNIGKHAFISGGSLVRKDVPPYTKAAREPLGYAGVNSVGLKRRGFQAEAINRIRDIYRTLYVNNNNINEATTLIEDEFPKSGERQAILRFIRNSERGVMKGYQSQNGD